MLLTTHVAYIRATLAAPPCVLCLPHVVRGSGSGWRAYLLRIGDLCFSDVAPLQMVRIHRAMVRYGTFDEEHRARDLPTDSNVVRIGFGIWAIMLVRVLLMFCLRWEGDEYPKLDIWTYPKMVVWMIVMDLYYCPSLVSLVARTSTHDATSQTPFTAPRIKYLGFGHTTENTTLSIRRPLFTRSWPITPRSVVMRHSHELATDLRAQELFDMIFSPAMATLTVPFRFGFHELYLTYCFLFMTEAWGHSGTRANAAHPIVRGSSCARHPARIS